MAWRGSDGSELEEIFWNGTRQGFFKKESDGQTTYVQPVPLGEPQSTTRKNDVPEGAKAYCMGRIPDSQEEGPTLIQFYDLPEN